MTRFFEYTISTIFIIATCFALYLFVVIAYGTVAEYDFEDQIKLSQDLDNTESINDSTFEFISWNVGFFALGEESDFFYDGGQDVFQSKETVQKNIDGIIDLMEENQNVDFFLLQEVDSFSWRSRELSFFDEIVGIQKSYTTHFGMNYASAFVPIPLYNPMGPVYGGLYSMSKFPVKDAFRYDLRTESLWPKRMFYLKRCFLTQRIQLEENELIVVNIHNSAYDKSGKKNNKEMKQIMEFVEAEFVKGNYVVVGGDWNQSPPNYVPGDIPEWDKAPSFTDKDIPEGWKWVADITIPTNRALDKPYSKEDSHTSVIDHYLVSPNVQVDSVAVVDMQFAYSDHQPVYLKMTLK